MDDLVAFLRARLDEDAEAAQSADDGPWWVEDADPRRWGEERDVEVACSQGTVAVLGYDRSGRVNAEHIARHDPARVLREVEAKREVLRLAAQARHNADLPVPGQGLYVPAVFVNGFAAAMEHTVRLFAAAYSDHPDYRQEWRP